MEVIQGAAGLPPGVKNHHGARSSGVAMKSESTRLVVRKNDEGTARRLGLWRGQSGQSLVELALITPILLVLVLGIAEMGRYAYISILVSNAARAGAAYGAQSLAQSVDAVGITNAADNDFKNNYQLVSSLAVGPPVTSCGCDSAGTITAAACTGGTAGTCATGHWVVMLSVTASGTFNSMFNYPGIPSSLALSSTATMRVAQR